MMRIHTSHRIFEVLLLRVNNNILSDSIKKSGNSDDDVWIELVKNAFNEVREECRKLMILRCQKVVEFFKQSHKKANGEVSCLIETNNEDYWNYPRKYIDCIDDFLEKKNSLFAISFGKFDVMAIQLVPHPYWATIFRTLLAEKMVENFPVFTEILSIPSHKIKFQSNYDVEKQSVVDSINVGLSIDKKYACLFFVSLRTVEKNCENIDNIGWRELITDFIQEYQESSCYSDVKESQEILLTSSFQFPLIIKAEFSSFSSIHTHIQYLKNNDLTDEVSTLIGINPESNDWQKGGKEEKLIDFGILVKLTKDGLLIDPWKIREAIKLALKNSSVVEDENLDSFEFYPRGYYWDYLLGFKTKDIRGLIRLITNGFFGSKLIKRVISVPHWDLDDPQIKSNPTDAQTLEELEIKYCSNKETDEARSRVTDLEDLWDNLDLFKSLVPEIPKAFEFRKIAPSFDIFNIRFYDLKFELEWSWCYLQQLRKGWWAEELRISGTLKKLDLLATECFKEIIKITTDIPDLYSTKLIEVQGIIEKLIRNKSSNYKEDLMLFKEKLTLFYSNLSCILWQSYIDIEEDVRRIKKLIFYSITQFNEKLESKQIVTASEPYIRLGERAGIMDQTSSAISALILDYCGEFSEDSLKINKWDGLILPTSDADFGILVKPQVLFLPFGFKFHIANKLLPIAHEAAHFVLGALTPESKTYKEFQENVWKGLYEDTLTLVTELEKEALKGSFNQKDRYKIQNSFSDLITQLSNDKQATSFYHSEIIVDLLTGLMAGPDYFKALTLLAYIPGDEEPAFPLLEDHPPIWLRIYFGSEIYKNYIDGDPRWLHKDVINHIFTYHAQVKSNIEFLNESHKTNPEMIQRIVDGILGKIDLFIDPKFYLIKILLSDKKYFLALWKWANESFKEGFLFFPYNYKKEDIIAKYNELKKIAERLYLNDEVVMDKSPKEIAAATEIPPIKRPVSPTGRIMHSLLFSKTND